MTKKQPLFLCFEGGCSIAVFIQTFKMDVPRFSFMLTYRESRFMLLAAREWLADSTRSLAMPPKVKKVGIAMAEDYCQP